MIENEHKHEAAPRVFLSHASDDKLFVEELARRLREDGIDAWFDAWEIRAGDKLVPRIFDEGIGRCEVFIVVLSSTSVTRPWVRDELEAGIVQRIAGQLKLIPIRLDFVEVPMALRATRYLSITDRMSYDSDYQELLSAIFNTSTRPPLGRRPSMLEPLPALPSRHRLEERQVLTFIAQSQRAAQQNSTTEVDDLEQEFRALARPSILDIIEGLVDAGAVRATRVRPAGIIGIQLTTSGWMDVAPSFNLNADTDAHVVLVHLAAAERNKLVRGAELISLLDHDEFRARMAVNILDERGLVIVSRVGGDVRNYHVGANARGRRRARELQ